MPSEDEAASPISSVKLGMASTTARKVAGTRSAQPSDSRYQSMAKPASWSNGAKSGTGSAPRTGRPSTRGFHLQRAERQPAARPKDAASLGEHRDLVRLVLDGINAEHAVSSGGIETRDRKGALPVTGAVSEAHALRAPSRLSQTRRRRIDPDQRRARLARHPQPRPARAARQIDQHPVLAEAQVLGHAAKLVEGEERDVGVFLGEVAAVSVLRPQPSERLASRDCRVHRVVAVHDDFEHSSPLTPSFSGLTRGSSARQTPGRTGPAPRRHRRARLLD